MIRLSNLINRSNVRVNEDALAYKRHSHVSYRSYLLPSCHLTTLGFSGLKSDTDPCSEAQCKNHLTVQKYIIIVHLTDDMFPTRKPYSLAGVRQM